MKIPEMIGKYPIKRLLGKGGMGKVWLGEHPTLGVPVAIKTLAPHLIDEDPAFLDRFVREAQVAMMVNHPNIVRVLDAGSDDDVHYMVMEYVDGQTVRQLLMEKRRLTEAEALPIVIAVTKALAAAADHGIIHRDVKPDNIMISNKGVIKLCDMGLAKQVGGDSEHDVTATGISYGTPAYIAPEQALDAKNADSRADIYSLGATLYKMLTGAQPFHAESPVKVITMHMHDPLPHPKMKAPGLPDNLCSVICKMMAKKPEERYQSATRLLADLEEIFTNDTPAKKLQCKDFSQGEDKKQSTPVPVSDGNDATAAMPAQTMVMDAPAAGGGSLPKILIAVAIVLVAVAVVVIRGRKPEVGATDSPPPVAKIEDATGSTESPEPTVPAVGTDKLYVVIDMEPEAPAKWPVTYLDKEPADLHSNVRWKSTAMLLRRIPKGDYMAGNPEEKQHRAIIRSDFYLGVLEVTVDQWKRVMGENPIGGIHGSKPANMVSYDDVRGANLGAQWPEGSRVDSNSFMGILRERTGSPFDLPAAVKWQYACRAGTTTAFSFGADSGDLHLYGNYNDKSCNYGDTADLAHDDGFEAAAPVGSFKSNPWGLYDMHGNVWEWTLNAQGSGNKMKRIFIGGHWRGKPLTCRSYYHGSGSPDNRSQLLGLRVCLRNAKDLKP